MATISFLDCCRFTPTAGGTTDWTVSAAVTGYQTPASAGAVNGVSYRYRAESSDLSQWEIGYGAYTVAGTVLARTTVLANSSGGTSKINFSLAPQVAIVALGEDLVSQQVGQLPGTSTNDSANAGSVGEYVESQILVGGAISVTTATATNITSISLGAGDWDVSGAVVTLPAGGSLQTLAIAYVSSTSATLATAPNNGAYAFDGVSHSANSGSGLAFGPKRFSLNGTTTVYLQTYTTFTVGTMTAYGVIRARRVR